MNPAKIASGRNLARLLRIARWDTNGSTNPPMVLRTSAATLIYFLPRFANSLPLMTYHQELLGKGSPHDIYRVHADGYSFCRRQVEFGLSLPLRDGFQLKDG